MGFGPFFILNMFITRPATQFDIELIQKLARISWEDTYANILSKEQLEYMLNMMYSEHAILEHFQNPNYHYFLIFDDETPLGFVGFEHHLEPNTTKLHRIYLVPEAKGKGAGKAGLELVKTHAKAASDSRIILTVNMHNASQDFYKYMGFTVYEQGSFCIGEGYTMDDYLMELHL